VTMVQPCQSEVCGATRGLYRRATHIAAETVTHTHTHIQPFYGPFFRDHPGEPVPAENFWTLLRKGGLTEADTPTIRLGATPSGLSSAHLHIPHVFTGRMPFLPPNQQCQSTEGTVKRLIFTRATLSPVLAVVVCLSGCLSVCHKSMFY